MTHIPDSYISPLERYMESAFASPQVKDQSLPKKTLYAQLEELIPEPIRVLANLSRETPHEKDYRGSTD